MIKDFNYFALLEPMKYYNNETDSPKRQSMINNEGDKYMATVKKDGDWAMLIHWDKDTNLIRSRSISKVTGVYGDYTAKLPHIVAEMNKMPDHTVLLAELCWDEPGTNANTVGTILRCLPPKAVERQKEKKLKALVFDALMITDADLTDAPYENRFHEATHLLANILLGNSPYLYMTQRCYIDEHHDNFLEWADEVIREGGEGLVIQLKDNPYMPGTRTAWKTLKLKQKMDSAEYLVVSTLEPNKEYEGKCPENWEYIMDGVLVTKPYYYGWKNGITILLPSGIYCDVASGLTDEDREWLASPEAQEQIKNGELYAEVKAMSINDLGKLRHGSLVRLRTTEDGVSD